jgi:hypothetical protein
MLFRTQEEMGSRLSSGPVSISVCFSLFMLLCGYESSRLISVSSLGFFRLLTGERKYKNPIHHQKRED